MTAALMERWPDDLIRRATARDLVVVVGSGVSRSSELKSGVRPPTWDRLIRDIIAGLGGFTRTGEVVALLDQQRLLDAAELVRQEAKRLGKEQDLYQTIRTAVDGPATEHFRGSEWHSAIVRLEPQIIVTTNYDKIIERATEQAFAMHDYSSQRVGGDVRRGEPTLLKIHGSVDKVEEIVLTRTDYTRLKVNGTHALAVLQALLLTRVALFIGYSLRDPDIQLLLENVLGARDEIPAHYVLMPDDVPDYEVDTLRFCYGVSVVPYAAASHDDGLAMITALADEVQASAPVAT